MNEKWDLQTYFDILGVSENSPQFEIHAAYQRAKQLYSASNPEMSNSFTSEEAKALEQLVEEAFAILGNYSLRSIYQRKNENVEKKIEIKPKAALATNNNNSILEEEIDAAHIYNGTTLKEIREYVGISIKQMTEMTKIKSTYIVAIEEDNHSVLPAPVYTRGFLMQIAKILNLPANKVATSYLGLYKSSNVEI